MKHITLLAIDMAKTIFQLHGIDKQGHCHLTKRLTRDKLLPFIAQLSPCTIAIEACGGSHYWARRFKALGHEVKMISPQYVKPFVKGSKTDRNDAAAIAEAASRPSMRFVPIKGIEQQDIQSLHRIREQVIQQRTALSNQLRGLLAEYGIVIPQGLASLRAKIPELLEDGQNELSDFMRRHIKHLYKQLRYVDKQVLFYDNEIRQLFNQHELAQRIERIEGVGQLIATAVLALGDLSVFKNGRHFAAFLGLVPKEYSSGNKQRLLGISKRGPRYLRSLLVQGAKAALVRAHKKQDAKSQWLMALQQRRGSNKACCALANKTARTIWAMATSGEIYQPAKACGYKGLEVSSARAA